MPRLSLPVDCSCRKVEAMSLRVVKKTCVDVCFLVQGMLENNVYFISDGEATMVVDPC